MKIIAVLNEKGGCGKSTVATNIASALHKHGKKVLLIDADQQGTARDWRAASPADADLPSVIGIDRPQILASSLKNLSADFVLIDGPAKAESMAASIIRLCDNVLLVIQPSGADLWASAATVKLIKAKQEIGGSVNAAFLINRANGASKLSKLVKSGDWNDYKIEQFQTTIGNRVAFAQALTDGISIYETQDNQGKSEIDSILKEMEEAQWV